MVKGQTADDAPWGLFLYKLDGTRLTKVREVQQTCEHAYCTPELVGMIVGGDEMVAVSCWACGDVKLVNMENGQTHVAYKAQNLQADFMCVGDPGVMWLSCLDGSVRELKCSSKTFFDTGKQVSTEECQFMLYLPAPHNSLVLSHYGWVESIACDTGQRRWRVENLGRTEHRPGGIVFHPAHQLLVVSNPEVNAILLLDPETGSTLHQYLSVTWGNVWDIRLCNQLMLFLLRHDGGLHISQVQLIDPEKGTSFLLVLAFAK